jgi:lysophospholipase L1-like esterase
MPWRNAVAGLPLAMSLLLGAAALARAQTTAPATMPGLPPAPMTQRYSFGPIEVDGYTHVGPDDVYSTQKGYGFDLQSKVEALDRNAARPSQEPLTRGSVTGKDGRPFFFSARCQPGVYQVTVLLGDLMAASTTTVKSETRRLMLEQVHLGTGQMQQYSFLVHLRVPQLPDGRVVRMKPREHELNQVFIQWDKEMEVNFLELDWDEKLTLEFSGDHPAVAAIAIQPVQQPLTVYLVGDSTMTDQSMEPWGAWGQFLPRWFKPPVVIANYAQSGEATNSFIGELRWDKLLSEIHPGDFVFVQFGINDNRMADDQFADYFRRYIDDTRAKGATPVLVTSQNLRRLTPDGKAIQTLGTKPDVMKAVAKEKDVTLIDLNEMSGRLYEAIGPLDLPKAFVDGTHQNSYGAYELSKCVTQGIIDAKLPIAQDVVNDWVPYNPSRPLKLADFKLPADPQLDPYRPGSGRQRPQPAGAARRGGRGAATGPATAPAGQSMQNNPQP